jgi:hypothetical protein
MGNWSLGRVHQVAIISVEHGFLLVMQETNANYEYSNYF